MAGHWPKGLGEINGEKAGAGLPVSPMPPPSIPKQRPEVRSAQLRPKDGYLVAAPSPGKKAAGKGPDNAQGRLEPNHPESEMTNTPSKTQGFITQLRLISN
jgi:predicted dienelactone hydrolase